VFNPTEVASNAIKISPEQSVDMMKALQSSLRGNCTVCCELMSSITGKSAAGSVVVNPYLHHLPPICATHQTLRGRRSHHRRRHVDGTVIGKVVGALPTGTADSQQIASGSITQIVGSTLSALVNGSATGTTASPATNVSLDSFAITTTTSSPVHVVCVTMPIGTGDNANASVTGFQITYTIWRNGANINVPVATFSHQNTSWAAVPPSTRHLSPLISSTLPQASAHRLIRWESR
jgi:hypothetical protein